MADSAEGRWVDFPALTEKHRAQVKSTLGPLVAVANPLDYHTFIWNNEPAMTATFTAMVSGGFDLNMLVLDFPRPDRCSDTDWWATLRAFEAALKTNKAQGRDRLLAAGEPAGGIYRRADGARHGAVVTGFPRRWTPPRRRRSSAGPGREPCRRSRCGTVRRIAGARRSGERHVDPPWTRPRPEGARTRSTKPRRARAEGRSGAANARRGSRHLPMALGFPGGAEGARA